MIHRRGPWRSFEAVEYAPLEWGDWFNHRLLLEPGGNIPPADAEDQYHALADNIDMAAWLTIKGLRQTRDASISGSAIPILQHPRGPSIADSVYGAHGAW